VPLYLNTLLAYATEGVMPETKEEVLRLFVETHEKSPDKAEALQRDLHGVHRPILAALAVEATSAANTAIEAARAHSVVSTAEEKLVASGQLAGRHQPSAVLDVLVNHNTLVRLGTAGVSFQHQQFQEWHASFEVERLMRAAFGGDQQAQNRLREEIINMPAW